MKCPCGSGLNGNKSDLRSKQITCARCNPLEPVPYQTKAVSELDRRNAIARRKLESLREERELGFL